MFGLSQKSWKKILAIALTVTLVLMSVVGFSAWCSLVRRGPLTVYASDEEHFKYASIGTEAVNGIPYWIWVVLPRLFPEKIPAAGGYTALGLTWEEGNEMPIGLTKETIGIDRVGMNCALCHMGTIRETPARNPTFIPGAPSTKFDWQRYNQFFYDCANDPRFTAGFILPEIEYNHHLSLIESQLYRFIVIPRARQSILKRQSVNPWSNGRSPAGPGRSDLSSLKINLLGLPDDQSVGNSDAMAIWNQAQHPGAYYHDGINPSLRETLVSSALRTGTTPKELNLESANRIGAYLSDLAPPQYPFQLDDEKARQGKQVFEQNCASCHSANADRVGTIIPIREINTDSARLNHWTQAAADGMNHIAYGKSWDLNQFRKTEGYVAPALDGIWARAPYLHNGSVPSLRELLSDPDQRPEQFVRGYDVYDPKNVGFVSAGESAESLGFLVDTKIPGNSADGHPFGTQLSVSDKDNLIEYLKTL